MPARDGIPAHVTIRQAAAALDLDTNRVRRWADEARIPVLPGPRHATRYIPRSALEKLEGDGWAVDWLVLIDTS